MVTRGGLTDHMCCWVQRVVVVLLVLGKVSCAQRKLIIEFGYPGRVLALLAVREAWSLGLIIHSVAVALARHLGSLPFKTRRQRFELELLVILESEQGRG